MSAWAAIDARIKRGTLLLEQWAAMLDQWVEEAEPVFDNVYDPSAGTTTLTVAAPPAPHRIGIRLSEATHQLRSAVDNAVFATVDTASLTERQLRGVQFPTIADEAKYPNDRRGLFMPTVPDEVADIVHSAQPFGRSEWSAPLSNLHNLNRFDKHRSLQVTTSVVAEALPISAALVTSTEPTTRWRPGFTDARAWVGRPATPLLTVVAEPPSARITIVPLPDGPEPIIQFNLFVGDPLLEPVDVREIPAAARGLCEALRPHMRE